MSVCCTEKISSKTPSVRLHSPFLSNDVEGNAVEIEEGDDGWTAEEGGEIARGGEEEGQ